MTKIGFIGLGNMGAPMARRLIGEGFDVAVYDANAAVTATFGDAAAASAEAAGADADIIITMLPNGAIVRKALLGEGGALASARPGTIVIDMSSSDAVGTVALGADLKARGFPLIDAPVSGGVGPAGEGKLSIMTGADDQEALERVAPVLAALSARLIAVGPLGAGHAAKAINNVIAASIIAVTSEGLLLGQRFGIEPTTLLEILNTSTGRSGTSETIFKSQILPRKFAVGFSLGLMTKDVGLAASLKDGLDLHLPILTATNGAWIAARDALGADADFSAYLRHVEATNGGDPITV